MKTAKLKMFKEVVIIVSIIILSLLFYWFGKEYGLLALESMVFGNLLVINWLILWEIKNK